MPSLDVVSEVDLHEVTNAVDQARREIGTRYDFKNAKTEIEHSNDAITLIAENEFQIKQMLDILYNKLAKRNVDISSLESSNIEKSGMSVRQKITVRQGIDKEIAKKIIKIIKDSKLKLQAAIQGEQVRVTGKKRDDLQSAIATLRAADLGLPLQFTNFRD